MNRVYRPWGPLQWLIPKIGVSSWSFLGVLGTEDRCTATYGVVASSVVHKEFIHILDPYPTPPADFDARYAKLQAELIALGAAASDFSEADLMADIDTIGDRLEDFIVRSNGSVILDLSSMPKWWFFQAVRVLLEDSRVSSLLVTYATAIKYGEQLSSDPEQLSPLPTFNVPRISARYDELIIGVGFAPLGLKDMYEKDIGKIRYLFPFPPGPPNFFRNWQFLRSIDEEVENRNLKVEDRRLVHMYDVPSAFEALCRFTKNGSRSSMLAPFGPKTLSLAMCLFALAAERRSLEPVHAFYTQPRRYNIDYSNGVKLTSGVPDIKAYLLKHRGQPIYEL